MSAKQFEYLRDRERNHSVVGACSRWVAAELLARLSSPTDASYSFALAALRRLVIHCRTYNGSQYTLQFIGDVEDQIAITILGRKSAAMDILSSNLAGLTGAVGDTQTHDFSEHYETLRELREDMDLEEKRFADIIWEGLILQAVPQATGWNAFESDNQARAKVLADLAEPQAHRLTAGVMLDNAAQRVGASLSEAEREARIDEILKLFPPSIQLYLEIIARIIRKGLNLSKPEHSNTIWDLRTAVTTATFARLHPRPLWFITRDRAVLEAATATGKEDVILSLEDYKSALAEPDLVLCPHGPSDSREPKSNGN